MTHNQAYFVVDLMNMDPPFLLNKFLTISAVTQRSDRFAD